MIKLTNSLCKGGENFPDHIDERSLQNALLHLNGVHFGWRCFLVECTPTKVVVSSQCMDNLDTTTYEGTMEEMASIVRLTKYYFLEEVHLKFEDAERLTNHRGVHRVKVALGIMAKLKHSDLSVHEYRIDDVVAAYVLHLETGCSMKEALLVAEKPIL